MTIRRASRRRLPHERFVSAQLLTRPVRSDEASWSRGVGLTGGALDGLQKLDGEFCVRDSSKHGKRFLVHDRITAGDRICVCVCVRERVNTLHFRV